MSEDRELLELAAKAAGYNVHIVTKYNAPCLMVGNVVWNPLEDDAQALRLAVKLGLNCYFDETGYTRVDGIDSYESVDYEDIYRGARRCIVVAAADMGRKG